MKSIFKLAVAFTAAGVLTVSTAYANGGPSVQATAIANVVTPVTITNFTNLDFGTFSASPTAAGTIDSSGNVSGGVYKVTSGSPATFSTSGLANTSYTVVGDSTVTLNDSSSGGSDTMTAALTYPSGTHTLNGSGTDSFNVTGVLTVAAAQTANSYSGMYNVSVHY